MKLRFLIPFALFVGLVFIFIRGLHLDPHDIPSPLINKPAPNFSVPQLNETGKLFRAEDMRGKVWLLNVWATWCSACREEHATLVELAQTQVLPIIGLSYKEVRGDSNLGIDVEKLSPESELQLARQRALAMLNQNGNPYAITALDLDGRVGIDYGVYGVPESYVIDKQGIIRMKQTGPISPAVWQEKILPKILELSK